MTIARRVETIASIAVVGLLVAGCLMVLGPFVSSILWAAVLCFTTWPVFCRLAGALGNRRSLAALLMTLLISTVLVAPFVVVGVTLANNVSRMGEWFRHMQHGLPPEAPAWMIGLPVVGPAIAHSWASIVRDTAMTSQMIEASAMNAGKWTLRHSVDLARGIAELAISMLVAFVFYRDGERLLARIVAGGERLVGDSVQRHLTTVGHTVRSVVYGVIGAGLAQAIMAGLGFAVAGVPSAVLLALLTFVLSFLPGGPPLVWIPATLWLFIDGRIGWGIFMAVWGLVAVSGIDNIVKPYCIMQGTNLPFITILFGVIGGIIAFGFIGIFLGPVLLAVGVTLAREFTGHRQLVETPAQEVPPPDHD